LKRVITNRGLDRVVVCMGKSIAIIIQKLNGGGAERVASNLSIHLSGGYNKHIIVYNDENICYPYDGNLICVDTKANRNVFVKLINNIKRIYKIRKIKSKYNIQSTISFVENPNLINLFTRKWDRVILSVRNFISIGSKGIIGSLYKLMIKRFYNKADCIVAVSKLIKADLIEKYGIDDEKIKVIYNPYDIEKIRLLAAEEIDECYKEIFNDRVIISIGRLADQKGQWHLIRAFKKVKEKIPNLKLVILGEGDLYEELKKLIEDYDLGRNVFLLGYHKNPFKYLSKSWLFVLSSLYEGFPNSLVEAMCCKIPVVSTDCKSGPREILAPDTDISYATKNVEYAKYGVLTPCCDGKHHDKSIELSHEEQLMAESICELYFNTELYNSYAELGLKRSEEFNIKKIVSEYESVL
jgi:glycosyltransferase involved in cell wall biosynthesis